MVLQISQARIDTKKYSNFRIWYVGKEAYYFFVKIKD